MSLFYLPAISDIKYVRGWFITLYVSRCAFFTSLAHPRFMGRRMQQLQYRRRKIPPEDIWRAGCNSFIEMFTFN